MLKQIILNEHTVPVPVPLVSLQAAMAWVAQTFAQSGRSVTKVTLDGEPILLVQGDAQGQLLEDEAQGQVGQTRLHDSSKLEITLDSPIELAAATLAAIYDLICVMRLEFRALAVRLWELQPKGTSTSKHKTGHLYPPLEQLFADLDMVQSLVDHTAAILDRESSEMAGVLANASLVNSITGLLKKHARAGEGLVCASLLLNRLEPYLKDLLHETEHLQTHIQSLDTPEPGRVLSRGHTG